MGVSGIPLLISVTTYIISWWHWRETDGKRFGLVGLLGQDFPTFKSCNAIFGGRKSSTGCITAAQDPIAGLTEGCSALFFDCCMFAPSQEAKATAIGGLALDGELYFDCNIFDKGKLECLSHQLSKSHGRTCVFTTGLKWCLIMMLLLSTLPQN